MCVLNVGKVLLPPTLSINNRPLPVVSYTRDLGVIISNDLSSSHPISDIVSRAQKRSLLILRAFVSRDVSLLVRAFIVHVRPILEYNSVIWSPHTIQDINCTEPVQRRFTKFGWVLVITHILSDLDHGRPQAGARGRATVPIP